ncbi:MAG: 30S ribosomal protein S9, partial [Bryobacteraceae bacterium]|nr:30S ribosomal protein S9 [Bryobacteraceae bacterium]
MAAIVQHLGTGRRKCAVARVFLRPGTGAIKVNNRPFEEYFTTETARALVRQPLLTSETSDKFDVLILVDGGGFAGQATAA